MKRIIIVCIFLFLITFTAIYTVVAAVNSYNYDMNPANGVDIMEGLGAGITIVLGGFVIIYEFDLFYTVYYFFVKPKNVARSILNIFSNISLLLIFFSVYIANTLSISEETNVTIVFLGVYVFLRFVYFMISIFSSSPED